MQINEKRKLHHFWSIPVYLITLSLVIAIIFVLKNKEKENYVDNKPTLGLKHYFDTKIFLISSAVFLSNFFINMFALFTSPEIYLRTSLIVYPILIIGYGAFFCYNNQIYEGFTMIFVGVLALIFGILLVLDNRIKYTIGLLKIGFGILKKYWYAILGFSILFTCFTFGINYIHVYADKISKKDSIARIGVIFMFYWTIFIGKYFMNVFVSSIVAYESLTTFGTSLILSCSLKNTLFALGSIFFAGLIVAVFYTLSYLAESNLDDRTNDRRRSGDSGGVLGLIAAIILHLIARFSESVVEYIADYSLIYVAIYGNSISSSASEFCKKITSGTSNILFCSYIFQSMISFLNITSTFLLIAGFYIFKKYIFNINYSMFELYKMIFSSFFSFLIVSTFCFAIVESLSFAFKTLIVLHENEKKKMEEKFPQLKSILAE